MNLNYFDWLIVFSILAGMMFSVSYSKGLMKSVSDFLVAGRSAGRYMVSISGGIAGLGAITIVSHLEMGYVSGFALSWWGFSSSLIMLFILVSGWVIYRFRQTQCLTLAQFFEIRYSRNFRIFTGIVAFISGIINFGIFPAVGARFFIYFCGLPLSVSILGIDVSTFVLLMFLLLSLSLYFVFTGGQIAVIIADFFQGVFVNFVFIIIIIFMFITIGWDQIEYSLDEIPYSLAEKEISVLEMNENFKELSGDMKEKTIHDINYKHENSSKINPFKTSHVEDFNFWYFLIGIIGVMYGTMSWQGTQAYNASARSAHEAKMGSVLAGWRGLPQGVFFLFIPIAIYTLMNHPDYTHISNSVNQTLAGLKSESLVSQLRGTLLLSEFLPNGLLGAFAAVMLAAFISTHDTYLHSWGSILVQDVIMPFRNKPFSTETHIKVLRGAIIFVAIFIFFFSLLFQQNQKIALFFAITGAIFAGGSGAVIIGGLYWKRGTTLAAWSAMSTGAIIAVSGILMKQISTGWLEDPSSYVSIKHAITYLKDINGQTYWGIGMGSSCFIYILVSILQRPVAFNLDKMLKRGKYINKKETLVINANPEKGWKLLGMGKEFTGFDKLIYIVNYVWTFGWTFVFIIGTIYNLNFNVDNSVWMRFWKIYLIIHICLSVLSMIWFTIGGFLDLKKMMRRLNRDNRDYSDDGFIKK